MTNTTYLESASSSGADEKPKRAAGLSTMRLAELQGLAASLGMTGTAKMRKGDLVTAIKGRQAGGSTPADPTHGGTPATPTPATAATEPVRISRRARRPVGTASADEVAAPVAADQAQQSAAAPQAVQHENNVSDNGRPPSQGERQQGDRQQGDRQQGDRQQGDRQQGDRQQGDRQQGDRQQGDRQQGDRQQSARQNNRQQDNRQQQSDNRGRHDSDEDAPGGRRRNRQRSRDRKRRGGPAGESSGGQGQSESIDAVTEDDVLVPVAGILEVLDNYAFLRTSGYLPGENDVYVPLGIVKKNDLRKGDAVTGAVRALREGEQIPARQKFNALARLDTINGLTPEQSLDRVHFAKLTPLYPQERLRLETESKIISTRLIDLIAPIGKGQRGLIVSPAKAGKTLILQAIANAITTNNPEAHLMVVLVDERPEEVTDMQRAVKGEVIASTFDRPATDHTTVAELAIERAKRLVEMGHDVVILLDSITRLGRAYNLAAPASGRILSGGVDSSALYPPKRFFGAARNIEYGGSLTILATALVDTGSKMDEVIFEEFKGTGNMELRLSRHLAERRIFPAIDVNPSGTRREEILMASEELKIVWKLRRVLSALDQQQGIELLIDRLKKSKSNVEFLMQVQKTSSIQMDEDD